MTVINPNEIQAVMLAAGMGNRLSSRDKSFPPKCLFKFNGKSLLQRHIEALMKVGIKSLTIVVGSARSDIFRSIIIGISSISNCEQKYKFLRRFVISAI